MEEGLGGSLKRVRAKQEKQMLGGGEKKKSRV